MNDLRTLKEGWDQAAREDAMYNILTEPGRLNGGWTTEDFFARGTWEVNDVMGKLESWGLKKKTERALDFGCGVGRITQALAEHYDSVVGIDISVEMITKAQELIGYKPGVIFGVNLLDDLSLFPDDTFDFIYSMLVLQHMPQPLQRGYVQEFFRTLVPEGVAMFEVPEGPDYTHEHHWLNMYGTNRSTVSQWVAEAGGTLVDIETLDAGTWLANRYTVVLGE